MASIYLNRANQPKMYILFKKVNFKQILIIFLQQFQKSKKKMFQIAKNQIMKPKL